MTNRDTTQSAAMTVPDSGYSIMPRNMQAQINEAIQMRDALTTLFEQLLVIQVDFDRIPGTDKPTLLKPGAEMLCKVFRFAPGRAEVLDKSEDWEKGVFSYTVGMPLIHMDSGIQVAYGIGAANSMEKKHRYRKAKDASGKDIQIENPDPADLQNTLIKMANKRAFVDAVLKATGASRMFTQDMEDFGAMTGQFEKASSKQISYIKQLFGIIPESEMLTNIASIVGREISSFDDLHRQEASSVIEAKKGNDRGKNASSGSDYESPKDAETKTEEMFCQACGVQINQAVHAFSMKNFGRPLCRVCQSEAKQSEQQ